MPKEIKLTRGYVALVDDADYEAISAFSWRVNTYRNVCYAARYLRVDGKKTSKSMHSQIMNCPAGMEVDHINCDGLDNRRCNLRIATRSQNRFNQNCWHSDEGPPLRVKIKFATYFRLHRLLTGTSPKRVWESLRDGIDLKTVMDDTPSHFNAWVQGWEEKLRSNFNEVESEARTRFYSVGQFQADRKTFALWANQPENKKYAPVLFKLLDKSPYVEVIWKQVRPTIEGLGTFKTVDE